jgi:membrane fusion protein (multidrug efflux system)
MNLKLISYFSLALLIIAGAASYHQIQKSRELARQLTVKTEALVPVTVATIESRPFRTTVSFTGSLLAVNRADLRAEAAGRVTRVLLQEGDPVQAGTLLSTQDEDELLPSVRSAEAQLAQAQAQADQYGRDNDRAQTLLDKHSVTRQYAQQAKTAYDMAMASVATAQSNLDLARIRLKKSRITAPFAGQVAQRLIQPGEVLSVGQQAFAIVDNRRMEIQADLPTECVGLLKIGMKASFRVAGFEHPFEATLAQISPSVHTDGRALRVRLEVANKDYALKSGLFAQGEIMGEQESTRPALPTAMLSAVGGQAQVFIVDQGRAKSQKVTVGQDQAGWRPLGGLSVGTQIVAQGSNLVADGSRLKIIGPALVAEMR